MMTYDEKMKKDLDDLTNSWIKNVADKNIFEKEIFPQMNKIKCGIIDKYQIVIVPAPFKSEGVQLIQTPTGEKRVQANLIYKDVRFATTFPMQPVVEMVWAVEVAE